MKPDKGEIHLGDRDEKTGFLKSIEGKDVTAKDVLMTLLVYTDRLIISLEKFSSSSKKYSKRLLFFTIALIVLGFAQLLTIVLLAIFGYMGNST